MLNLFEPKIENCLANNKLELVILPTEQCNFRCTYCYEKFDKGVMSAQTISGIKNLMKMRYPELDALTIAWFGGEPLLAYDLIVDVMTFAQSLRRNKPSLVITSGMTTNAYTLDLEKLRTLTSLGVFDYQISFDGDKDYHDKVRIIKGGGATFDQIWKNVLAAKYSDLNFCFIIRIHVNKDNVENVRNLIDNLTPLAGDKRFQVSIVALSQFGGKNDLLLPVLKGSNKRWDSIPLQVTELRNYANAKGFSLMPRIDGGICYASKLNALVIRSDGNLSKCTVALYDPRNFVGKLSENGTVTLDKNACLWWSRGLFNENKDDLACPMGSARKDCDHAYND